MAICDVSVVSSQHVLHYCDVTSELRPTQPPRISDNCVSTNGGCHRALMAANDFTFIASAMIIVSKEKRLEQRHGLQSATLTSYF
jgi:hypothetical protein